MNKEQELAESQAARFTELMTELKMLSKFNGKNYKGTLPVSLFT